MSAALQKREALRAPSGVGRLAWALVRRSRWLLAVGLGLVGWGAQAWALAHAPVALVLPLVGLGTGLLVLLGMRWLGERFGRAELVGIGMVVAGTAASAAVAVSIRVARAPLPDTDQFVIAGIAVAGALAFAVRRSGIGIGVAAGFLYGGTTLFSKELADRLASSGLHAAPGLMVDPALWFLLAFAAVSLMLEQLAFRGANAASVAAAITGIDTAGPIAAGFLVYHERFPAGPDGIVLGLSLAVALAGMVLVARAGSAGVGPDGRAVREQEGGGAAEPGRPAGAGAGAGAGGSGGAGDGWEPRRVVILTAGVGEGHNAAARALTEGIARTWPSCEVHTLDAVERMGRWVSWLFRNGYRLELSRAPGMYQLAIDALFRWPWYARATKRLMGALCGVRLRGALEAFRPDLVVSTYPIASAGLDWLRRTRGDPTPFAAFITDFAPHPFWVFSGLDVHLVVDETAVAAARELGARGAVRVAAPPVRAAFHPRDPGAARRRLGLPTGAFVVLVTGGGWGLGSIDLAVRALVDLPAPRLTVVVLCGHNDRLRSSLGSWGVPDGRLRPLGWTDDMPDLVAAADVVVSNAGGLSSLEALSTARPVLLFDPIPGHGRLNADFMARSGVTVVCPDPESLASAVLALCSEAAFGGLRAAAERYMRGKDLADDLRFLASPRDPVQLPSRLRLLAGRGLRLTTAVVASVVILLSSLFFGGTHLAHAARGAPAASEEIAVTVSGWLPPAVVRAVVGRVAALGGFATLFVTAAQGASDGSLLAGAAPRVAVEPAVRLSFAADLLDSSEVRTVYVAAMGAVARATGKRPRYVADLDNEYSPLEVVVSDHLRMRRVVFDRMVVVSGPGSRWDGRLPRIPSGGIVDLAFAPGTSPGVAASAVARLLTTARHDGLRPVTVANLARARDESGG